MCKVRGWDKRTRAIYFAGNLFLMTGLLMTVFAAEWGAHHRVLYDSIRFAALLLAIWLLLWAARLRRHGCNKTGAENP